MCAIFLLLDLHQKLTHFLQSPCTFFVCSIACQRRSDEEEEEKEIKSIQANIIIKCEQYSNELHFYFFRSSHSHCTVFATTLVCVQLKPLATLEYPNRRRRPINCVAVANFTDFVMHKWCNGLHRLPVVNECALCAIVITCSIIVIMAFFNAFAAEIA